MLDTLTRHREASCALGTNLLRMKAIMLKHEVPLEVVINWNEMIENWTTLPQIIEDGCATGGKLRTCYIQEGEMGIEVKMEDGALFSPHFHTDADEYIYLIRGAVIEHITGVEIYPGEHVSIEAIKRGTIQTVPYVIPAGRAHFIQATQPNTVLIVKLKRIGQI